MAIRSTSRTIAARIAKGPRTDWQGAGAGLDAASEQIWIIERGAAELLLGDDQMQIVRAGDVVRTPAGKIHGLKNGGGEALVYLAITTPPVDFQAAYKAAR